MAIILALCLLSGCTSNKNKEENPETAATTAIPSGEKLFTLLPASHTGVEFNNQNIEDTENNIFLYEYFHNGSGIGAGDFNNDGLQDLYFASNQNPDKLYLNKGNLQFTDITQAAGIKDEGWSTGVTVVDLNNDGWLDIYVCRAGAPHNHPPALRVNLFYLNTGKPQNGQPVFEEKAADYGIADPSFSTQAVFLDYDLDGDLDLYVANHPVEWYEKVSYRYEEKIKRYNEYTSAHLFRNNGPNQKFTDVSKEAGILAAAFNLSCTIFDVNDDKYPDIYVTNDYLIPDFLWVNNKKGGFTNQIEQYFPHISTFAMGADIADYNNDGLSDIAVTDMMAEDLERWKTHEPASNYDRLMIHKQYGYHYQYKRNTLQLNNGPGKQFSEIGQLAGMAYTDWSWAILFADYDLDGWKDLYITNGYRRDIDDWDFKQYLLPEMAKKASGMNKIDTMALLQSAPEIKIANYAYKNNGDLSFTKSSDNWGVNQPSFSNGAVYVDLDNDGDLEIITSNINENCFIYRNNSRELDLGNYVTFSLQPNQANNGILTTVTVTVNNITQTQFFTPTRGYMSSVDWRLYFGLGKASKIDNVEVVWPDGKKQILANVPINQLTILKQAEAQKSTSPPSNAPSPLFEDITASSKLQFKHIENSFNDFKVQPLLPHMLSSRGPALAADDVNNDGLDDVYIGGANEQIGVLFIQKPDGTFAKSSSKAFANDTKYEDQDALFFDADGDKDLDLYVVTGSSEIAEVSPRHTDRLYTNDGKGNFTFSTNSLPPMDTPKSCAKAADYDMDGDLDLFVAGLCIPGKYPLAPQNYLLKNNGKGQFSDVIKDVLPDLQFVGMIRDLVWTDFNSDKTPDLFLVGEWMNLTLYMNQGNGKYASIAAKPGWWNSIEQGDFDGDGDLDFIVGNSGTNNRFKSNNQQPLQMYINDFDDSGTIDPLLTLYLGENSYPFHSRDEYIDQMPSLKGKFLRYRDFATKRLEDIFKPEQLQKAMVLQATTLQSAYIENKGNGQIGVRPLENALQMAPLNDMVVSDFNADGVLDIVAVGNSFAPDAEIGQYDAAIGWYLQGDGTGNFANIASRNSGFYAPGDCRKIVAVRTPNKGISLVIARNNDKAQVVKVKAQRVQ
ncbi:MAG: VCBS repeat-containing protein [Chitinophagales bacterium]|nr:VCBS repeat-containing protein [Sphingobacteriales bacterium]MBP9140435.1 VCBS repeat-containing protein [Chitinophagales bacterium]MCC7058316.1 VCBS repeat-containing protein [Chitinophagales bacterium]MDA0197465.1 VCBS repeat-containing protein [Bacteroidota bacterium]